MNEQWKSAYREGFVDGYAAAKKEVYNPIVSYGTGQPRTHAGLTGTPTGGLSYSVNNTMYPSTGPFVTGMTVASDEC